MKKISNFFTQNILWKLLSLALAITLWFIAINVQDPFTTRNFNANLQLINLEALDAHNLVILNEDELRNTTIGVRVTARRKGVSNILSDNVQAYIDIGNINLDNENITSQPLDVILGVEVRTSLGYNEYETSTRPVSVPIIFDRIITQEIPVTIEKISDVSAGYVSMLPTANPSTVTVTGPSSYIQQIDNVVAGVNLQGETSNLTVVTSPVIYDINGDDITELFTMSQQEIEVRVPINRYSSVPVLRPNIIGDVAEGHTIIDISYSPQSIQVVGSDTDINNIQAIPLGSINVTNQNSSIRTIIDIREALQGTNLVVRSGTPNEVIVNITISDEPVTNITVPISQINIIGDASNITYEEHINVNLRGDGEVLQNITYNDISGTINVENLQPGTHEIIVDLTLPDGATLIGGDILTTVIVNDEVIPEPPIIMPENLADAEAEYEEYTDDTLE